MQVIGLPHQRFTERNCLSSGLWVAMVNEQQIDGYNYLDARGDHTIFLFGRLKSGVTAAEAEANLNVIARHLEAMYPERTTGGCAYGLRSPG